MSDVTRILSAIEEGDSQAAEQLLPLVYEELRKLAAQKMLQETPGQTLQATALVHEAYIRLVNVEQIQHWNSRGHFFAAAAEAMRRILIDNARRRKADKRGGSLRRLDIVEQDPVFQASAGRLLAINEALEQFEIKEPDAAKIVKLRVFAGLSVEQAADAAGMSRTTAYRQWTYARAWLRAAVHDGA